MIRWKVKLSIFFCLKFFLLDKTYKVMKGGVRLVFILGAVLGAILGRIERVVLERITSTKYRSALIEVSSAVAGVFVIMVIGTTNLCRVISSILLVEMCLVVSLIDMKEGYIYPKILCWFGVSRLTLVHSWEELETVVVAMATAISLYLAIYLLGQLIFQKEMMGIGDIYYLACLALWLDQTQVILVGLGAFWVALAFVGGYYVVYRRIISSIAFAPMISIACGMVYFYSQQLLYYYWQWWL